MKVKINLSPLLFSLFTLTIPGFPQTTPETAEQAPAQTKEQAPPSKSEQKIAALENFFLSRPGLTQAKTPPILCPDDHLVINHNYQNYASGYAITCLGGGPPKPGPNKDFFGTVDFIVAPPKNNKINAFQSDEMKKGWEENESFINTPFIVIEVEVEKKVEKNEKKEEKNHKYQLIFKNLVPKKFKEEHIDDKKKEHVTRTDFDQLVQWEAVVTDPEVIAAVGRARTRFLKMQQQIQDLKKKSLPQSPNFQ